MKLNLKRVLAFVLALAMCLSLAACGGNGGSEGSKGTEGTKETEAKPGEITNIVMWVPIMFDTPDPQSIEDEVNKYSEERYGIHYDLEFVPLGDYNQKRNMALTGDELDVFWGGGYSMIKNGQLYDITELYEPYKAQLENEEHSEFLPRFQANNYFNGRLYTINYLVDRNHHLSFNMDQEVADKYGIQNMQEISLAELEALFPKMHEDFPDRDVIGPTGTTYILGNMFWTWDPVQDAIGVLPNKGQDDELVLESIFDNEDYINFVTKCEEWYNKGYINPDILSNTNQWAVLLTNHQICGCFDTFGVNNVAGSIRTRVKEVGNWCQSLGGGGYSINANSKHPEKAFEALMLCYTDKDIATVINSGVEGKNYTKNADGTISYPGGSAATSGYGGPTLYWALPGSETANLPLDINGPTYFKDLNDFCLAAVMSKGYGFIFDPTPVMDEWTACTNVLNKYYYAMASGAVPVKETLETARAEMKAAGEDKVIAEKQKQLDEWLKNKK